MTMTENSNLDLLEKDPNKSRFSGALKTLSFFDSEFIFIHFQSVFIQKNVYLIRILHHQVLRLINISSFYGIK